ncbi:MAG TPA: rod shape-determining protein MreC [Acidobacteriaceae bacterium]|nr:rod shape-determining protein MreC [Acidobacteriaceae bacterium]
MESFFSRYRNVLVLITVLLAQVIGLAVQVRAPGPGPADKGGVRLIRSWVVGMVTPPERLFRWTGHSIRGVWSGYIDLIHVRKQNRDLQTQLGQLRLEEDSLAEDARQGLRLQALLGFQEKYIYKTIAAQVIGTSGTEQSHVLFIDKGADEGLRPDMPVITPDGIVGKTRDVFAHTSQVLEISDATSGAGVILVNTRIRGVLRGDSWGQPQIVNVSPDERIKPGEPVVTSGGDGIFPRGLAVGSVQRVVSEPEGTLVNIQVKPAANLSRLEEVLVITSTGSQMPSQMQDDLSQAEQKTADILAERLPSRSEPNAAPAASGSTAAQQPSPDTGLPTTPPPPPPAEHPDRFSMGATPPAADMVPGQPISPNAVEPTGGSNPSASPPAPDDRHARPATTAGSGSSGSVSPQTAKPGARNQGTASQHPAKPAPGSPGTGSGSTPQGGN